eukprot:7009473-Lingulodinium_polyedra.AAC.1
MPAWAGEVALQRDHFQGTLLVTEGPDGTQHFWRFLYDVQNPLYLALGELAVKPHTLVVQSLAGQSWQH